MTNSAAELDIAEYEICAQCDQPGILACGGCDAVFYCSRQCQVQDWTQYHHLECKHYQNDEWREQVYNSTSSDLANLVSSPSSATNVVASVDSNGEMAPMRPSRGPPPELETDQTKSRDTVTQTGQSGRRAGPAVTNVRERTLLQMRVLTWDTDDKANAYTYDQWMSDDNTVSEAWRAYIRKLDNGGDMPHLLLVSLQAVQNRNKFYQAFKTFLAEETTEQWESVQVYDESILRSFQTMSQSQQLVFWRPSTTLVNVWKTGTTCFRVGLRLGINCEYGAAGVYLTYQPRDQAVVPPIPLIAVSAHFDPASASTRVRHYKQMMNRLVSKLRKTKRMVNQPRLPLDCATVIVAGDMGWRRKKSRASGGDRGDPLTIARFGDQRDPIFPFPEWAETGQPGGGRLPLVREFRPPYRPTCPMRTAENFEPYYHDTVLQARQAGSIDAYAPDFPPTHCDRVFLRFPSNALSLSTAGWSADVIVPPSIQGRHEAVEAQIPLQLVGACQDSPLLKSTIGTSTNTQDAIEVWHDEPAIAASIAAFYGATGTTALKSGTREELEYMQELDHVQTPDVGVSHARLRYDGMETDNTRIREVYDVGALADAIAQMTILYWRLTNDDEGDEGDEGDEDDEGNTQDTDDVQSRRSKLKMTVNDIVDRLDLDQDHREWEMPLLRLMRGVGRTMADGSRRIGAATAKLSSRVGADVDENESSTLLAALTAFVEHVYEVYNRLDKMVAVMKSSPPGGFDRVQTYIDQADYANSTLSTIRNSALRSMRRIRLILHKDSGMVGGLFDTVSLYRLTYSVAPLIGYWERVVGRDFSPNTLLEDKPIADVQQDATRLFGGVCKTIERSLIPESIRSVAVMSGTTSPIGRHYASKNRESWVTTVVAFTQHIYELDQRYSKRRMFSKSQQDILMNDDGTLVKSLDTTDGIAKHVQLHMRNIRKFLAGESGLKQQSELTRAAVWLVALQERVLDVDFTPDRSLRDASVTTLKTNAYQIFDQVYERVVMLSDS